jgi:hypothetical protein
MVQIRLHNGRSGFPSSTASAYSGPLLVPDFGENFLGRAPADGGSLSARWIVPPLARVLRSMAASPPHSALPSAGVECQSRLSNSVPRFPRFAAPRRPGNTRTAGRACRSAPDGAPEIGPSPGAGHASDQERGPRGGWWPCDRLRAPAPPVALAVFRLRGGCILWYRKTSSATSAPYLLSISGSLKEFPVDNRDERERCSRRIVGPAGASLDVRRPVAARQLGAVPQKTAGRATPVV